MLASPLVRVIFPGNTPEELDALAPVLIAMCIGLLPFSIMTLQQRYCFASEQGKTNFAFQGFLAVFQLVVALCAVNFADPGQGVLIVALGQSGAYVLGTISFVIFARHQVRRLSCSARLGCTFGSSSHRRWPVSAPGAVPSLF